MQTRPFSKSIMFLYIFIFFFCSLLNCPGKVEDPCISTDNIGCETPLDCCSIEDVCVVVGRSKKCMKGCNDDRDCSEARLCKMTDKGIKYCDW